MIRRALAPSLIAAVKVVVSLGLLWCGFHSVSDDDFARVAIAQQFSLHAQLDPSGTSWLPLPFWVYGGVMKVFGPRLATAQLTSIVIGVYAAIGVFFIARAIDRSERAALVAALLSATIPHAAHYGVAMLPDYPTAVLALAAAATLGSQQGSIRATGAVLACLATLCRYEIWPIAGVVTLFAVLDALRRRASMRRHAGLRHKDALPRLDALPEFDPLLRAATLRQRQDFRWFVTAASVAPAGAILWMLNGVARHGDALFFVKRVTAYRRALGGNELPIVSRLLQHPRALLTGEPELVLLALTLAAALWFIRGRRALWVPNWLRPCLALGALMGFLVVGNVIDGAPTHHEDRTLLTIWLALTLLVGEWLDRLLPRQAELQATARQLLDRLLHGGNVGHGTAQGAAQSAAQSAWPGTHAQRWLCAAVVLVTVGAGSRVLRAETTTAETFVDRSNEIQIGRIAAERIPRGARLAVYAQDYGFFAIEAAFARPSDSAPLVRRDPRTPERDPLANPNELAARLDAMGARYLVVPARHRQQAESVARVLAETSGFVLMER